MRILDRYIIRAFIFNYLLAVVVLVGMAVLLDLIVNLDNFSKSAAATTQAANTSAGSAIWNILDYYSYQSLVMFQTVSGAIPLLAAGFTMVRMTRHRELTAMLASGVSLLRVAVPVVIVSLAFGTLSWINQEYIISQPFVVEKLLRRHDEVNVPVNHNQPIYFVEDPRDNSLLVATEYDSKNRQMTGVLIVQRDENGSPIGHIAADNASWETPPNEVNEAWKLHGVTQSEDRLDADPAKRFVGKVNEQWYQTGLTPQQLDLMFRKKAVDFLSTAQVRELAANSPPANQPLLYKVMDLRVTQLIMNIIMLLIGIPFLLTREPDRLVKSMFYCTVVSGIVFVATFVLFQMAGTKMDPLLAAWLPVLIFGPCAVMLLGTIKT